MFLITNVKVIVIYSFMINHLLEVNVYLESILIVMNNQYNALARKYDALVKIVKDKDEIIQQQNEELEKLRRELNDPFVPDINSTISQEKRKGDGYDNDESSIVVRPRKR